MRSAASWLDGTAAHGVSLLAALALAGLVTGYPRALATSAQDVHHGRLVLMMWGICAGFVHGVGFVPRSRLMRWLLGPLAAWLLMAGSAIVLIVHAEGG